MLSLRSALGIAALYQSSNCLPFLQRLSKAAAREQHDEKNCPHFQRYLVASQLLTARKYPWFLLFLLNWEAWPHNFVINLMRLIE